MPPENAMTLRRFALVLAVLATPALAAEPAPTREHLAPPGWEDSYHEWHYTPVVVVGDTIIVSGIPAAVGDTYQAKVRWMFEQLKAHLEAAGSSLADVVELQSIHATPKSTEEFRAEFQRFAADHRVVLMRHLDIRGARLVARARAGGVGVHLLEEI